VKDLYNKLMESENLDNIFQPFNEDEVLKRRKKSLAAAKIAVEHSGDPIYIIHYNSLAEDFVIFCIERSPDTWWIMFPEDGSEQVVNKQTWDKDWISKKRITWDQLPMNVRLSYAQWID
jgi:hypothetical protein